MSKLIIVGAGGHGKVVYDIAHNSQRFSEIYFLDDDAAKREFYGASIIGNSDDAISHVYDSSFVVAIGNNVVRSKIQKKLEDIGARIVSFIHETAVISNSVSVGKGSVIMPMVVINADTIIGDGCIINTACVIEHDSSIGDFSHISPNATICGTVSVGKYTWVGAGATIINNKKICDDIIISANSTVIRDIFQKGIVYTGIVK